MSEPPAPTPPPDGGAGTTNMTEVSSRLFVFANHKAGMDHVDKDKMNKVIYEMSKDSSYFKQAEKHAASTAKKIEQLKQKVKEIREAEQRCASMFIVSGPRPKGKGDRMVEELESSRDTSRCCIYVDMDMFYCAVELRDRPHLHGKPVAVGGMGMISTANYEARKFGVRSAMPGFIAVKLCPELIFVPSDFKKYTQVATEVRKIFAEYDPNFSSMGLDEAYLDVTDYINNSNSRERLKAPSISPQVQTPSPSTASFPSSSPSPSSSIPASTPSLQSSSASSSSSSPIDPYLPVRAAGEPLNASHVAAEIRRRIFETTQLTASAGIACDRMLAKICSDVNKPNGQFTIAANSDAILRFTENLSVRKIPGIGKVMERILNELGLHTCGQLREKSTADLLCQLFSPITSTWLIRAAMGISDTSAAELAHPELFVSSSTKRKSASDDAEVHVQKSISHERTFRGISDFEALQTKCVELSQSVAKDMARKQIQGKTITLKLKTSTFAVKQRSLTLPRYISSFEDVSNYAVQLLTAELATPAPIFSSSHADAATKHTDSAVIAATAALTPKAAPSPSAATVHAPASSPSSVKFRLMGVRMSTLLTTRKPDLSRLLPPPSSSVSSSASSSSSSSERSSAEASPAESVHPLPAVDPPSLPSVPASELSRVEDLFGVSVSSSPIHPPASHSSELVESSLLLSSPSPSPVAAPKAAPNPSLETPVDVIIVDSQARKRPRTLPAASSSSAGSEKELTILKFFGVSSGSSSSSSSSMDTDNVVPIKLEPPLPSAVCPVCGETLPSRSNILVNRHIDACLGQSKSTVTAGGKSLSSKKNSSAPPSSKRTKPSGKATTNGVRTLDQFFGSPRLP